MHTDSRSPARRVVLVVAVHADRLREHAAVLGDLDRAGHTVRLAYLDGAVDRTLEGIRQQHRLRATDTGAGVTGTTQRLLSGLRRLALRGAERVGGTRRRLLLGAKFDPWFHRAVRSSDLVLLLDGAAAARPVVERLSNRPLTLTGPDAVAVPREQQRWDQLSSALAPTADAAKQGALPTEAVQAALGALAEGGVRLPPAGHETGLLSLAEHLMHRGRYDALLDLVVAVERLGTVDLGSSGLAAVRAYAELAAHGSPPDDLPGLVTATLTAGDVALARDDVDHAAGLTAVALALLFHRDLHVDVARTPLVERPAEFLAPMQGYEIIKLLASGVNPRPRSGPDDPAVRDSGSPGTSTRVLVLPGAYGRFAAPVLEALRADPRTEPDVLDLPSQINTYRFMVMDPDLVGDRLRHALGQPVPADTGHLRLLDTADVVFADWGDKGAVWASMFVPAGTRLVVRVHGVDALAPWIHLVDWTRVSDLIVVSPHMGDLVQEMLGERLRGTRLHVVGNVVDAERFTEPTLEGAEHVLCMVGWGKRVKDPLWSVEVLAELLRRDGPDSDWRLLLVGADFPRVPLHTTNEYATALRARVGRDDVRRHIEYVGETEHVPKHLRRAGFILSSSIRESFHIAVLEGVAAGAVPVVRDWPLFAGRDGARRLYPRDWVVDTPQEAADRIQSHRDTTERARAAAEARQELARFSPEQFEQQILQVLLEPGPSPDSAAPVGPP